MDLDFASIVAPATAQKIAIEHAETGGKVSYRVFIDGEAEGPAFTGDADPDMGVHPGATYTFLMRPANQGPSSAVRTYTLKVLFQ